MTLTPLFTLLGALAASLCAIFGVTDPQLASNVQSAVVLTAGLVVVGLAYCHHTTLQNREALSVDAARAANDAAAIRAQAPAAPANPLDVAATPATLAAIGAAVEAARTGTLATAVPAPRLAPPVVGQFVPTAGTPGSADDFPTTEIPAIPGVPSLRDLTHPGA